MAITYAPVKPRSGGNARKKTDAAAEDTVHPNDHPERRHRPRRKHGHAETSDEPAVPDSSSERVAEERNAVRRATGKDLDQWYALLDAWDAPGRSSRQIAAWLTQEHDVSAWWAQKLTITYEQARGVREPGARSDGTYAATASKTVPVSAERLFEAVLDPEVRRRWLPDAQLRLRASRPGRSARFDWEDDATRVVFDFQSTGESSSVVAVDHQRLQSSADVERCKTYWRERLTMLRDLLVDEQTE